MMPPLSAPTWVSRATRKASSIRRRPSELSTQIASRGNVGQLLGITLETKPAVEGEPIERERAAAGIELIADIAAASDQVAVVEPRLAAAILAETARPSVSADVSASLGIASLLTGRFSVSIFARTLGLTAGQAGTAAAEQKAAARLAASFAQLPAELPGPIAPRSISIVAEPGVASSVPATAARVAISFGSTLAALGQRFFDLRFVRLLTGRGLVAAIEGRADGGEIDGRGSAGTIDGKEA